MAPKNPVTESLINLHQIQQLPQQVDAKESINTVKPNYQNFILKYFNFYHFYSNFSDFFRLKYKSGVGRKIRK